MLNTISTNTGMPNVVENLFPNIPNFIAHIISTIVIVVFLTFLLYKPAKKAMEERRKRIDAILDDALTKQLESKQHEFETRKLLNNAIVESKKIIKESELDSEKAKQQILDKTKKDIEIYQRSLMENIEISKLQAEKEIKDTAVDLAFEIANKILIKHISKEDQKKMIKSFLDEIK